MTHSGRKSDSGLGHASYTHLPKAKIVRREDFTNPGMIDDVKERLIPRGWSVVEERFWRS